MVYEYGKSREPGENKDRVQEEIRKITRTTLRRMTEHVIAERVREHIRAEKLAKLVDDE